MKNKSINNLMKVVMISGIIVIFNICNVVPSFASDNFYISKATVDDSGSTVVKYSDGSWYSYNNLTRKYMFKPSDSNKEFVFNFISDMDEVFNKYNNIKNISTNPLLKNNFMNIGFGKHSDKIYTNDLKTDEQLENYAKQWLKDNYNLELNMQIYFSSDLESDENGRFSYKDKKAIDIKINKELQGIDLICEKTLIHELTHIGLFENNKEFDDDTEIFEKECTENGSNTNNKKVGFLKSHLQCTL